MDKNQVSLLEHWVQFWMWIRRIPLLEQSAWWLSDRLYALAMLIRQGSESMTLHRLDNPSPEQIIANVCAYNSRASRQPKAPLSATYIAVVRCMDRRLNLSRIFGDLRFVDDIANPGATVGPGVIEALRIAVEKHGVRVIFLLGHTGCAARSIACSDEARDFPPITATIHQHDAGIADLLADPVMVRAMTERRLAVLRATIDSDSDRLDDLQRYTVEGGDWRPVLKSWMLNRSAIASAFSGHTGHPSL